MRLWKVSRRRREAQPVEGKSARPLLNSTKAQGTLMRNQRQNRRSLGERMTSEKYATAVVHYLR